MIALGTKRNPDRTGNPDRGYRRRASRGFTARVLAMTILAAFGLLAAVSPALAQKAPDQVPFFDPARKPERPDTSGIRAIRFLTDDDYPPFHFPGPDGQLTGFNVDLARAICFELKIACTIQSRRWETLIPTLEEGRGDAIIASMRGSEADRARIDFGIPYYRSPGRFVSRSGEQGGATLPDASVKTLDGKSVAVITGSAHAAFLSAFFPKTYVRTTSDQTEGLKLLARGEVDATFGDGVSLAVWLNTPEGYACCRFLGGSFFESRFFGPGAMIGFRKDSTQLRKATDYALFRLSETGVYQNLMLKYFPVSFY